MTSVDRINQISSNTVAIPARSSYAAIIGLNSSQGARSPKLWNAAFKAFDFDSQMIAIDVLPENLEDLLMLLKRDSRFLGGAIAAPHKEAAAQFLGNNLTNEARLIGSINCLFRDESANLCGTNTDGEGSLAAFESVFGQLTTQKILILGTGGTGKAVAAYFASAVNDPNQVILSSRSQSALRLSKTIKSDVVDWSSISKVASEVDIIVNCTSLGSTLAVGGNPLPVEAWSNIRASTIVYDVIYDPDPTPFLKSASNVGLKNMNGSAMNFEQAVLGFHYALSRGKKNLDSALIREAMKSN